MAQCFRLGRHKNQGQTDAQRNCDENPMNQDSGVNQLETSSAMHDAED